jgi:type IV pilus assembly protein PilB
MRVRYRKDGGMVAVESPPRRTASQIIRRLKVLAGLYTDVTKEPQDGQMDLRINNRVVNFRLSILPTQFGEKAVLRVLDKGSVNLDLQSLGISGRPADLILDAVEQQFGMILVTGPTGSGKTTTLYTTLALMNKPDVNIITVENPIEYSLPGINQVPITEKMNFAAALRSILRQDPDIIMLGEIRDEETADVAVKAGMTGHMVISTLHTNDAPSAITRLVDMGVDRFNISQTLTLVIAQRLVRRLCKHCREAYRPDGRVIRLARLTDAEADQIEFLRGRGCSRCSGSGFAGRLGVYEALEMTPEIREMTLRGASTTEIRQRAVRSGMDTLLVSGVERVRQGLTTLEEVVKKAS